MSELITRTARLVPYAKRPKQVPSFVTAYSYEPLAEEPGADLGNLFVIIEVLVSGRSSEDVADLVISTMADHYYNQATDQSDPLRRFEAAIKATNQELANYVNQGNAAWIGKMSAVVAIQTGSQLHLTQTGSAEAFLYRGKSAARISANQGAARPTAPSKTFGSIASGDLEPGDRLLLATPALVHQLSLTKLKTIVSDTSPNNAIAEITQLLRGGASGRIAALVIEITTPELAALQVRSEEPSEIQLGTPDNVLEAAKMAAAPIAQATVSSSRRAGAAAKTGWKKSRPHLQQALQVTTGFIREQLAHKDSRKRLFVAAAILLGFIIVLWQWQTGTVRTKQLETRYQNDYNQYQLAVTAANNGDKTTARNMLSRLQGELTGLFQAPGRKSLDAKLKQSATGPKSVAELAGLTATKLDQIEGLHRVDVSTVASFSSIKNSKPTHFELAGNKAYTFDEGKNPSLYIANITTNIIQKSKADTSRLGAITATTISSSSDGIYLLTDKPSVWFYNFAADSLTEQSVGVGQWPAGTAIASYAGNLYILGGGMVYKHVRTYSGYSPKAPYLAPQTPGLANATAMAVDGMVFLLSPSGLREFSAGAFKQAADTPSTLKNARLIRSSGGGNSVIAIAGDTKRIGFWDNTKTLKFAKQYELGGVSSLHDAAYDPKTQTVYALVNSRLVKFTI